MHGQRIPDALLPHQVTVERYLGSGAYGDVYAEQEHITRAQVEDQTRLVRAPPGGAQTSHARIHSGVPGHSAHPGDLAATRPAPACEVTSQALTAPLGRHPTARA